MEKFRKLKWSLIFHFKIPFSKLFLTNDPFLSSSLMQFSGPRLEKIVTCFYYKGKRVEVKQTHKQQGMGTRKKGTEKAGREKSEEAAESLESASRSFQSTYLRG